MLIEMIKENPSTFIPLILIGAALLALFIFTEIGHSYSINKIKRKTVGDGQHGSTRHATTAEIHKSHKVIPYRPQQWRQGLNRPTEEGFLFGLEKNGKALLNQADNHILIVAGTGGGKTTGILAPNIEYALALGNSFVLTDSKGDLLQWYGNIASKCYRHTVVAVDFRNPMESHSHNMLYTMNRYYDEYKKQEVCLRMH